MKRKDIDKAAERSTEKYVENGDLRGFRGSYRLGFIDGAGWRINRVWHDIKEMPENNRMILIIMQHDIPTVIGPDNTFFKEEIKDRHIQRWAYIKDLIPMED